MAEAPEILNEREVAAYLRQKPRTIRLWRKTQGLPHIKITHKVVVFRRTDIDEWLSQHSVTVGK